MVSKLVRALSLFLALPLSAAGDDWRILQPPAGERDLVLVGAIGRARVEEQGRSSRLRLASDERLTAIVETASGWVAAGLRGGGGDTELTLWTEDALGVRRLPAPPRSGPSPRLGPVPLADQRHWRGLAWLEGVGPSGLTVRAAEWTGAGWSPVATVSEPGPGSQTGLAGTLLADGSWLLVWSAFDGQDDEIVWSVRRGEGWSPPRRLAAANRVPDVAPALAATPDGALAAWNRLEDDGYRLYLARYQEGRWSPPAPLGGSGALFAELVRLGGRLFAVHQNAALRGWTVLEIDDRGRPRGRADLAVATTLRPVVGGTERRAPTLRWPGGPVRAAEPWLATR